jgi:hypothetical protein
MANFITGSVNVTAASSANTGQSVTQNIAITINVRPLPGTAADGSVAGVAVAAGYEEIIVYTAPPFGDNSINQSGVVDECLYLYDPTMATSPAPAKPAATANLPPPPKQLTYVAVDLLGARSQYLADTRAVITRYINACRGGEHPGGTGPVQSHP